MQLAIHVVQNRHAGEQKSHWDKTNKEKLPFQIMYVFCLSCPSATFALQPGGFVPREWLAAKGLLRFTKRFNALFSPAALVDPGHVTIPFCDDPDVVGRGAAYGK